jgi:hypothetical protein
VGPAPAGRFAKIMVKRREKFRGRGHGRALETAAPTSPRAGLRAGKGSRKGRRAKLYTLPLFNYKHRASFPQDAEGPARLRPALDAEGPLKRRSPPRAPKAPPRGGRGSQKPKKPPPPLAHKNSPSIFSSARPFRPPGADFPGRAGAWRPPKGGETPPAPAKIGNLAGVSGKIWAHCYGSEAKQVRPEALGRPFGQRAPSPGPRSASELGKCFFLLF